MIDDEPDKPTLMRNITAMILLALAVMFVAAPLAATEDNPNYGYCKSGERVTNIKYCKENGGKF